jgi:uncharacterized membrane protein
MHHGVCMLLCALTKHSHAIQWRQSDSSAGKINKQLLLIPIAAKTIKSAKSKTSIRQSIARISNDKASGSDRKRKKTVISLVVE